MRIYSLNKVNENDFSPNKNNKHLDASSGRNDREPKRNAFIYGIEPCPKASYLFLQFPFKRHRLYRINLIS